MPLSSGKLATDSNILMNKKGFKNNVFITNLRYFNKQLKATLMFYIHFMICVYDDCFNNVVTSNSWGR